jgi:hypothetical protein
MDIISLVREPIVTISTLKQCHMVNETLVQLCHMNDETLVQF